MIYKTYTQLKTEVLVEADMEAEEFIQASEVLAYFNDGIREACAHIQKMGIEDDYFNKSATYSLTNGQATLSLPTDIYAAKITGLTYSTSSTIYSIHRIKGKDKSIIKQRILQSPSGNANYTYDIENINPVTGFQLRLYPSSYETTVNCIVMDYVRTVVPILLGTDLVDIPEFYSFIKAFVKMKCFDKEGSAKAAEAKDDYEKELKLMLETLREITPDHDNLIQGDFSHYEESM